MYFVYYDIGIDCKIYIHSYTLFFVKYYKKKDLLVNKILISAVEGKIFLFDPLDRSQQRYWTQIFKFVFSYV